VARAAALFFQTPDGCQAWDFEALMESHMHVVPRKNSHTSLETREIAMAPLLATFEDSALIKLTLAGQTECFTVLMNRHLAAIKKCIGSMVRNTTDADDLLQEVLLKVWRHLSTFRSESSFRTWMTRVAVNEALQSYRRGQSRPLYAATWNLDVLASPDESPLQSFSRAQTTQVVRKAVVEPPAIYRRVLILRDLEQLSIRETAQRLHSSIPAVKTRLFRGRLMLLAALQSTWRARSPAGGAPGVNSNLHESD
jgi:RNA polymerase sigma-70 factor, ECF subfamily